MSVDRTTPSEEEEGEFLSESFERLEALPDDARIERADRGSGRRLLVRSLGSEDLVNRAIGRPALDGRVAKGASPVRHVRLPQELDDALTARAAADRTVPSQVMRDALRQYLGRAS